MEEMELKPQKKEEVESLVSSEGTKITEEKIEFKNEGEATTSLADLLKKAGF